MASILIEPGFRLGKYEVVEHIATGGMGAVYKAVDREIGRLVALKVLSTRVTGDQLATERFRREARHAARLNHPNIVTFYEFGDERCWDLSYLAFEFIHGIDLAKYIATRGKLHPREVRLILLQVCWALSHAFGNGVVHRDIKPSNIMLARIAGKVRVKLTDLGLAIAKGEDEFRLTREGHTVGTIDYLAPEQARDSQAVDTRSDIYSLGCTAYHMLAGKAPFAEGGLGERLFKHLETPPPDVRKFNSAVSADFWVILQKMLAKDPADRYANPSDLIGDLKRLSVVTSDSESDAFPINSERRRTKQVSIETTKVWHTSPGLPEPAACIPRTIKPVVLVSTEHACASAALCQRANQILVHRGSENYARQLLEDCLSLDPLNLAGRTLLRTLNQKNVPGILLRWFASLNVLAAKSRMRSARSQGDWRKVFEQGEQVLAYHPGDTETHLGLAKTALEIGQPDLARWFLEQGCQSVKGGPNQGEMEAALARFDEEFTEGKPTIDNRQQGHRPKVTAHESAAGCSKLQ